LQANSQVAAHLRVSPRTVQRRLRAWGFSFEEILDDVRRTEALRHVILGENSAIEIAFLLGYSDPAHFTRAFRRWTGMAPRDYARIFRPNHS
jgi:AraC-like DNA-binding protein